MAWPERRLAELAATSVRVIAAGQAPSGAYVACPVFPPYRYAWLRDGAFVADAMSRAGERASAEAFFAWCARVLERRRPRVERLVERRRAGEPVSRDEFLHTRYTLDGNEDDAEWAHFQLDGYGAWLWALGEHVGRHGADPTPYAEGARLSAAYVGAFWDEPCFDWWEEREGVHTATLAAIAAGLRAAERLGLDAGEAEPVEAAIRAAGTAEGRLGVSAGDDRLDASLLAVSTPFRVLAPVDPLAEATAAAVTAELLRDGGVHRHRDDEYYGGGRWLLLTALLGWHEAETGREDGARKRLGWVAEQAGPDGALPEQSSEHLLSSATYESWVARWGLPPSPLLWSHAFYLDLAVRLGVSPGNRGRYP